jgi:hypothetical protein
MLTWLLFSCGSESLTIGVEVGPKAQLHDTGEDLDGCTPLEPEEYQRAEPGYYFGPLVFGMDAETQTMNSVDAIRSLGMNTVSLRFAIPYDENGDIRYPLNIWGRNHTSLEDGLCHLGNIVHGLKEQGMAVLLSGEPHYYDKVGWMEQHPDWTGEPPALADIGGSEMIENFLIQVEPVLEGMADLAERYKIELVSPISEADRYLGPEPADRLMHKSVAQFEGYGGKLLWQVHGEMIWEREWEGDLHRLDLEGFDVVGFSLMGCDSASEHLDIYIDTLVSWAEEDGVPEIIISELGCVEIPDSVPDALANFERWRALTADYATGLIVLDTPQTFATSQGIAGTWVEEWLIEVARELGFI